MDQQILKIPVLGNVVKTASLVDATRTLSILISSGVPILEGFAIVTDVNDNSVFKDAFARVTKQVEKGSLARQWQMSMYFRPLSCR
jgi:type IV pilus assembly protein PilC